MPLPEGYRPREGDELLIRAKVAYDVDTGDDAVHLRPVGSEYKSLMIPLDQIHALHFRRWNEGDRVLDREFNRGGTVVATIDDQVWVKVSPTEDDPSGFMSTFDANDLQPYVEAATADIGTADPMGIDPPPKIWPEAPGGALDDPILTRDEAANR